jgi:hypothetical protein
MLDDKDIINEIKFKDSPNPLPVNDINDIEKYMFYSFIISMLIAVFTKFIMDLPSCVAFSIMIGGIALTFMLGVIASSRGYRKVNLNDD